MPNFESQVRVLASSLCFYNAKSSKWKNIRFAIDVWILLTYNSIRLWKMFPNYI